MEVVPELGQKCCLNPKREGTVWNSTPPKIVPQAPMCPPKPLCHTMGNLYLSPVKIGVKAMEGKPGGHQPKGFPKTVPN